MRLENPVNFCIIYIYLFLAKSFLILRISFNDYLFIITKFVYKYKINIYILENNILNRREKQILTESNKNYNHKYNMELSKNKIKKLKKKTNYPIVGLKFKLLVRLKLIETNYLQILKIERNKNKNLSTKSYF